MSLEAAMRKMFAQANKRDASTVDFIVSRVCYFAQLWECDEAAALVILAENGADCGDGMWVYHRHGKAAAERTRDGGVYNPR